MIAEHLIFFGVQALGTGVAGYLAYQTFQKRRVKLGSEPTLPQYFINTNTYRLGIASYCLLIVAIYWLLTWQLFPLQPLVDLIVKTVDNRELVSLMNGLDGKTIIPLIAVGLFLFLVAWESKLNPLLGLRDGFHDAFAIPRKAAEVYNALISSRLSEVDDRLKTQISNRLLVASIDSGDFEKSSSTVEYKWAHNSLLFDRIQNYANDSSFRRLFAEPSLKWGPICIAYNAMSEKVVVWKEAEPHYTKTVNLIKELDDLTGLLCRFLASLVVFGSASENEIWATVKQLGGNNHEVQFNHTYKYIIIFTAAISVGVIFGREVSVTLHNAFLFPNKPLLHFDFTTLRWVGYAILIYVVPITLVFFFRLLALRHQQTNADLNYGFYLAMMIMGFIVSTAASTLILELTYYKDNFNFLSSFLDHMRWGILPALISGYVAFRMDTPVSDSETLAKLVLGGTLRFLGWGLIAVIIMLYATDDLTLEEVNLRFTLVATAFFSVGLLGASVRFKTAKRTIDMETSQK